MFGLMVWTIVTSAVDSLNPFGITQQFVLQGMVKKPGHIWYFIASMGVTNFTAGMLAYYGMLAPLGHFIAAIMAEHSKSIYIGLLIAGVVLLIAAFYCLQNAKLRRLQQQAGLRPQALSEEEERQQLQSRIKSVTPAALVVLGVLATASELSTALPYFAFLGVLINHTLSVPWLLFIMIIYNLIYSLPLMVMYFIYIKAQKSFDRFYAFCKRKMAQWSLKTIPSLLGAGGALLMFHSLNSLLP